MKKIYLLLGLILFNCSSDPTETNETLPEPLVRNFNYFFMHAPNNIMPSSNSLVILHFDSNNYLISRIGGFSPLAPATGFSYAFDTEIVFNFTYLDKEVVVERVPDVQSPLNKKTTFIFNDENKLAQKIVENPDPVMTFYTYNSFGKISNSIINLDLFSYSKSEYYYNTLKNIDSIVTKNYQFDTQLSKTVEVFSDYDTAENPMKKLVFFEDTFYRTLSENNYAKYEKFRYSFSGNLVEYNEKVWDLQYDENGNIIFGEQ
ncbi:MAG: hypothetical protein R2785_12215 [Flavobacteriaceae bacterium]